MRKKTAEKKGGWERRLLRKKDKTRLRKKHVERKGGGEKRMLRKKDERRSRKKDVGKTEISKLREKEFEKTGR